MTRLVALIVIAIVLVWPVRAMLIRARWTELTPRAAIVLWQSFGLAVGIAVLGACIELTSLSSFGAGPRQIVTDFTSSRVAAHPTQSISPNELFALTAGLIVVTLVLGSIVVRAVGISRARAHQRLLIDLVGTERVGLPNTRVLEHPQAAAFSLPGRRPRVVVSSGAIDALANDELAAVLAHERAHLRARHDLALFPFRLLAAVLPKCRMVAAVNERVTTLVEMAADDRALVECEPNALARALCALATASDPPAVLSVTTNGTTRRVERAIGCHPRARLLVCGTAFAALAVLALPLVTLFVPMVGK